MRGHLSLFVTADVFYCFTELVSFKFQIICPTGRLDVLVSEVGVRDLGRTFYFML